MKVYKSTLCLEGAPIKGENPLPMFRNRDPHREVKVNSSYPEQLKKNLGYEKGRKCLPYRVQDRYTRVRQEMELQTIVLENDHLQAVFLPEYGGRLYALKDKKSNRDLLYRNPVFQPANLAILNAWFSGGIEWNIGQLGHTFTTCSPIHAAKLTDDEGNEFLRIYEYERCKNVFWQIDFHLPEGADQLRIYVRIVNDQTQSVPMYWWTNIAVVETPQSRVFSSTSDVIYLDQKLNGFGLGQLPVLPSVPNTDVTYPLCFPYANEYFFQTPEECQSPWEAIAYEDGRLFYERSTSLLRYRKMFCWGNHAGGRRWCDYLAKPGEGAYIEIQGGLAPTQLHGIDMPAQTVWDFTQVMGVSHVDTELANQQDWGEARDYVQKCVDLNIQEEEVYSIHQGLQELASKTPQLRLHRGSEWGAIESLRRVKMGEREIPQGFDFAEESFDLDHNEWHLLLKEGRLPEQDVETVPGSWMVQKEWLTLLKASLQSSEHASWNAYMHLGVMLYEHRMEAEAIQAWETSLKLKPSAWVYRNLAEVKKHRGEMEAAFAFLEKAYQVNDSFPDRALAEEYLSLLIQNNKYEQAWSVYQSLPDEYANSDRIQIIVGAAALELNHVDFINHLFEHEFAVIREGEVLIIELWYKFNALQLAQARNEALTEQHIEEAKLKFPPPANIDFRLIAGS